MKLLILVKKAQNHQHCVSEADEAKGTVIRSPYIVFLSFMLHQLAHFNINPLE